MPSKATLRKYRLTADQHARIIEVQNGVCGYCRGPFTTTPHIDHDHQTGKIRGITHAYCNRRRIGQHVLRTAEFLLQYMKFPPANQVLPADHTVPTRKRRKRRRRK